MSNARTDPENHELMVETEKAERKAAEEKKEEYIIDSLRKYTGIGDVISRSFAWEICDFKRFKNGKHFGSYLGLTPTPFSSGKMFIEQGISKQGNQELRRLAIQLAWLWHHWQPDSKITKKWAEQLKRKGRQRKTAIVAMARQLMVAIYRHIVHGEEIEGAKKNR
jgi:transposase